MPLALLVPPVDGVVEEPEAPAVTNPAVNAEEIWAAAFQAGKDYALQCAFQGVTAPPANPYAA